MISVILPYYNKAAYVRETIASLLKQTFSAWECVIVDDGSTDGGLDLVADLLDQRFRKFVVKNGGVSAARNTGVAFAKYDLLAFLDADDLWEPEFLEKLHDSAVRNPASGLHFCRYTRFGGATKDWISPCIDTSDTFFGNCLSLGMIPVWTCALLAKRSVVLAAGGFEIGRKMGEDISLWLRMALGAPVSFVSEPLASYRETPGACSTLPMDLVLEVPARIWSLRRKDDLSGFEVKKCASMLRLITASNRLSTSRSNGASVLKCGDMFYFPLWSLSVLLDSVAARFNFKGMAVRIYYKIRRPKTGW